MTDDRKKRRRRQGQWAREWVRWPGFAAFWTQTTRWTILERPQSPLLVELRPRGEQTLVTASLPDSDAFRSDSAATLRAAGIATEFIELDSLAGHDAFLVDFATFDALLRPWFAARAPHASRSGPTVPDIPGGSAGPAPNDT